MYAFNWICIFFKGGKKCSDALRTDVFIFIYVSHVWIIFMTFVMKCYASSFLGLRYSHVPTLNASVCFLALLDVQTLAEWMFNISNNET